MRNVPVLLLAAFIATGREAYVTPRAAAAERPSFDCAKAATPTEKAICADGKLARLDVAIARAFRQLKKELATVTDEVDDEQKEFLIQRDTCGADGECLAQKMAERRAALALEADKGDARGAFIGRYENAIGWMIVRHTLNGKYELYGQTADPGARWTCDVAGELMPVSGGISTVDVGEDNDSRPIKLRIKGSSLVIAESDEPERRLSGHSCGHRGTVEGSYRRARKLRE